MAIKVINWKWTVGWKYVDDTDDRRYFWKIVKDGWGNSRSESSEKRLKQRVKIPRDFHSVYTTNEVESKLKSVNSDIAALKTLVITNDKKVVDTIDRIDKSLSELPKIIIQDKEFRKQLKDEIIAEIKAELENE